MEIFHAIPHFKWKPRELSLKGHKQLATPLTKTMQWPPAMFPIPSVKSLHSHPISPAFIILSPISAKKFISHHLNSYF